MFASALKSGGESDKANERNDGAKLTRVSEINPYMIKQFPEMLFMTRSVSGILVICTTHVCVGPQKWR